MKRMMVALAFLVVALPAVAQVSLDNRCLAPDGIAARAALPDGVNTPVSALAERATRQISERPLFLDVRDLENTTLLVRYFLDDSLWLRESFTVPASGGATLMARSCREVVGESSVERPTRDVPAGIPVVELLTSRSDLAGDLRDISAAAPERVRVEVLAGDRMIREATLAELIDDSTELSRSPIEALVVRSQVTGPGTVAPAPDPDPVNVNRLGRKLTCEGLCQSEYEDCIANECGFEFICETCEVEYQDCLNQCDPPPPPPPPTCTPKTEYFYDSYLVAFYPSGYSACYYDPWGYYYTVWHDEWVTVVRTDYIQKTTASNCNVTYTLVNYWYTYYFCFDYSFSPCYSYPFYPGALCY